MRKIIGIRREDKNIWERRENLNLCKRNTAATRIRVA